MWNTDNLKGYIEFMIAPKSQHSTRLPSSTKQQKSIFYDYSQIITSYTPVHSPRFLNNIYLSIYHYLSESQINAIVNILSVNVIFFVIFTCINTTCIKDLAMTDSMNTWITVDPDPIKIYHEIMLEAMSKSKKIILQSELIWIFKLAGYLNETYCNGFNIPEIFLCVFCICVRVCFFFRIFGIHE